MPSESFAISDRKSVEEIDLFFIADVTSDAVIQGLSRELLINGSIPEDSKCHTPTKFRSLNESTLFRWKRGEGPTLVLVIL